MRSSVSAKNVIGHEALSNDVPPLQKLFLAAPLRCEKRVNALQFLIHDVIGRYSHCVTVIHEEGSCETVSKPLAL
ncbi:hypothetical protein PR003_g9720 [Phytophthora rubi]|uniref:Uncharacterized protein n=1 Tax=Phytophthora rubi TaxID=129364 RepID=A0A6A3MRZ6_9STRA|nr:hypothetical protein PR001_g9751 [Phytophthora rubi]KAE9341947.1 hypothetical protein PR003_g9720 [Phytophthora rubi]